MPTPSHDPARVRAQYATAANLEARVRLHQRFSENPRGFAPWAFDRLRAPALAAILEVGCGPGGFWRHSADRIGPGWRLTLTDLSPGMVGEARRRLTDAGIGARYAVADAQSLPFPDGAFHGVVANHMLYHVPDLHRALAELARVLRAEGCLVAGTNGRRHLREIDDLVARVDPARCAASSSASTFGLDDGEADLRRHFAEVDRSDYPDALRITEPEPVLAYIESMSSVTPLSPEQRRRLLADVEARIARDGFLRVGKQAGVFVCRRARRYRPARDAPSPTPSF